MDLNNLPAPESRPGANPGFVFSMAIAGDGLGSEMDWDQFQKNWNQPGLVWLHSQPGGEQTESWLREESGVSEAQANYLLADETRPGMIQSGDSLLIILRTLNQNPDQRADDMVSVRMWMDTDHMLTFRLRRVYIFSEFRNKLRSGSGPTRTGEFLVQLIEKISNDLMDYVMEFSERVSQCEVQMLEGAPSDINDIASYRIAATRMRTFLIPQVEVLQRLDRSGVTWLQKEDGFEIKTSIERLRRVLDDLGVIYERLALIESERDRRLSESLNRRMYLLSMLSAIFLPLNLVASLLGMNVGGIPGSNSPVTFWVIAGINASIAASAVFLLIQRKSAGQ